MSHFADYDFDEASQCRCSESGCQCDDRYTAEELNAEDARQNELSKLEVTK